MSALPSDRSDAAPRRALGTRIRRVPDGYLIGAEDQALQLDGPAALIFASLDGHRRPGDVARLVADEYDIDEDEALQDVHDFLDDLTARGIVEWQEAS